MPLTRVTYDEDLTRILVTSRNLEDGRPTHKGSDTYTQAAVLAAVSQDLRAVIARVYDQIWPDTADTAELERHAAVYTDITRKPASPSSGLVEFTGEPGVVLAAGSALVDDQGQEFELSAEAVVGSGGSVQAAAESITVGQSANLGAGDTLTLVSPPSGLDATGTVPADWAGGAEAESDAELLARHLWLLRHPPAGGNKYDYVSWAMSVPGVVQAVVFPLRRGLGTCDVCILSAGADRLPGSALLADVQAVLDAKRPAGIKDSQAYAPDLVPVDVGATIAPAAGYDYAALVPIVQAEVAALFSDLLPGDKFKVADAQTAVRLIPGVDDLAITAPASNVTATVDESTIELLTAGTITVTEAS